MLRRRWVRWVLGALGVLVAVLVVRTLAMTPEAFDEGAPISVPAVDEQAAVGRLSEALRIPTVSISETHGDPEAFRRLHGLLERSFPKVHETLSRSTVNEHSLVFQWRGTDPSLAPILLLAHMDVVPVEPGTEGDWGQPPFSGAVVDGEIWGRGAMDDKTAVMGLLEATESLLATGFTPKRTVMFAFGHDEEVGGRDGAQSIAARLEREGKHFAMILDEGGAVVQGSLPGVEVPIAFVGIAEKGYASLELTVSAEGGHSSMPSQKGAIARLGRAVRMLDDHQMAARVCAPTRLMLEALGPHMPFSMRIAAANLWLLERVLVGVMLSRPASAASVRTTTAPTIFEAGTAENVIAQNARAVVNFRILPGDTIDSVIEHAQAVIGDRGIEVKCLGECWNPSEPSPIDTPGFAALARAVAHTFEDAVVTPYLVVGATDAHHYQHLADGTYRFLPIVMRDDERARLHGTGERIRVDHYLDAIRFYQQLIVRATE